VSVGQLSSPYRSGAWSEWLPVILGLMALYVPTLYELATTLWDHEDYAHGPIILGVILWLIWRKRTALADQQVATRPVSGVALLVFGLLVYALGRSQEIVMFEVGSLIPILAGTLLVVRGWPAVRAMSIALLFIVFLVPLPGSVVDTLTVPLKLDVSTVAEQLLYRAGFPVGRSGVVLTIGQYQLLVADACSGLNSMFSLSALGLLYAYLMRYKSWVHNALLLAAVLPIAFCANVVRVMILMLVTYEFGEAAGQGFVHGLSGMVMFAVALFALFAYDGVLRIALRRAHGMRPA
jgi:exosortase B